MAMESLTDTTWDVVLAGTGLPQSLLALALSQSGQRILHIDRNEYYGGPNATLSLQDAQHFTETVNSGNFLYNHASISIPRVPAEEGTSSKYQTGSQLAFSRAYSLSLSPQIIYTSSSLLSRLVASRSYRQLEFTAVGSWWLYDSGQTSDSSCDTHPDAVDSQNGSTNGQLVKIPGSKEDVFSDDTIDRRAKRALTNFLRFATDSEGYKNTIDDWETRPFGDFLLSQYDLPPKLRAAIHALTLLPKGEKTATTSEAMHRISQHLSSIGLFGPGFNAVLPKWGGLGEIVQVACRAGAVGGAVYALGRRIQEVRASGHDIKVHTAGDKGATQPLTIVLDDGSMLKTSWLVGCSSDVPYQAVRASNVKVQQAQHNVSIASSSLANLFVTGREQGTSSAVAVICFPTGSIATKASPYVMELPPVYVTAHSSDTGECPIGQCVLYATVWASEELGKQLVDGALARLMLACGKDADTRILWSLDYSSGGNSEQKSIEEITPGPRPASPDSSRILVLPEVVPSISFDDNILNHVRHIWTTISGEDDGFLVLETVDAARPEEI